MKIMTKYFKNYISVIALLLLLVSFVLDIFGLFQSIDSINSITNSGYGYSKEYLNYFNTIKGAAVMAIVFTFICAFLCIPFFRVVAKKTLSNSTAFPLLLLITTLVGIVVDFITLNATKSLATYSGGEFTVPSSTIIIIVFMFIIAITCVVSISLMKSRDLSKYAKGPIAIAFGISLAVTIFSYATNAASIGTPTPLMKAELSFNIIIDSLVILLGLLDYVADQFAPKTHVVVEEPKEVERPSTKEDYRKLLNESKMNEELSGRIDEEKASELKTMIINAFSIFPFEKFSPAVKTKMNKKGADAMERIDSCSTVEEAREIVNQYKKELVELLG